ncbi:MAG: transcription antitermination factor NusB [Bacteroidales bacterium]|nr:transcription antitermination factor NusB [Bacteroidales bacterium]MEE0881918.1 transcription antitermination factor NusB [Bacteroidales bacterium]MEE1220438.1 transcription antitermination factor NusB [Bacteroidales bacterium]
MLSRHFLRVKVLQSLYAYIVTENSSLDIAEKELDKSISETYDLEVYLFSSLLEMRDIAENQIEDAKGKFFPTEEEKNPNMRFVNNELLRQLSENTELTKAIEKLKINWSDQRDLLKRILNKFKASNSYKDYMSKEEITYDDDKKAVIQLLKNYLLKNESFLDYLAELKLYWESDFQYVGLSFLKFLKEFKQSDSASKSITKSFGFDEKEIRDFALDLFRKCIGHYDEFDSMFDKHIENWDKERIAFMDTLIIKMGLVELVYCPEIPVRVTLNEYIEMAKEFSTERSNLFVNGLLDRFLIDLRASGKIRKLENEEKEE